MHDDDSARSSLTRRRFLQLSAAAPLLTQAAPAVQRDASARPLITSGVQSGDVEADRAVVWCRTDRPARLRVRFGTTDKLVNARERVSAPTSADADFTARLDLTGLPPGQRIVYEARFESAGGALSEPVRGAFRTPARTSAPVRIVWGGDVCGQGWGLDEAHGGMKTFASMQAVEPDLFIHSGDLIYADGPISETVRLDDGSTWRNLVEDGVGEVAQTLDQFRGRYRYNLRDAHLRAFNAEVPMVAQWDDHEVLNNWYPTEVLGDAGNDARYTEKRVAILAARAKQAFFDYTPIREQRGGRRDARQVYRVVRRGPLADVFVLDCRTYRGPNTDNLQAQPGPETAMLAATQRAWLEEALARSTATWKIIACDQPLGVVVPDGKLQEGFANNDPRTLGREHEVAALLSALKRRRIRNVLFVTADVHYSAAHHYDPGRATYTDFDPFWEFVAGPLHAGTFAPGVLDATFGPEAVFTSGAPKPNRPPSDGLQFFGQVAIDPATRAATVTLHDRDGRTIFTNVLPPAA
ncbi:MAG: alkaline phosphatase D family protein [Vicinamibacteraceae bacterium]